MEDLCGMGVTFREFEPFYAEKTDHSGLFESLDHTQPTVMGQEGESGANFGGPIRCCNNQLRMIFR